MRSKSFWALMTVIVVTAPALVPSSLSASDSVTAADAAAGDALDSALAYVNSHPADLGVTSADLADLYATSIVKSRHSGVTHVNLNQRFQGLEVFDAHATVNVAADGRVVFAAGAFVRGLRAAGPLKPFSTPQTPLRPLPPVSSLEELVNLRILEEDDGEALVRAAASRMRPSRHGSAGSRPATAASCLAGDHRRFLRRAPVECGRTPDGQAPGFGGLDEPRLAREPEHALPRREHVDRLDVERAVPAEPRGRRVELPRPPAADGEPERRGSPACAEPGRRSLRRSAGTTRTASPGRSSRSPAGTTTTPI